MSADLFTVLSRYAPRQGRSSLENFCTEALAYLLRGSPAFAHRFLAGLRLATGGADSADQPAVAIPPIAKVLTQFAIPAEGSMKFPDLALQTDAGALFLVEVKVDAGMTFSATADGSYEPQVRLYRDWLDEHHREKGRLLTLTKYPSECPESCHGAIRWADVYRILGEARGEEGEGSPLGFLLGEFATYLEEQRMQPKKITSEHLATLARFTDIVDALNTWLEEVEVKLVEAGAERPAERTRRDTKPSRTSDGGYLLASRKLRLDDEEFWADITCLVDGVRVELSMPGAQRDGALASQVRGVVGGQGERDGGYGNIHFQLLELAALFDGDPAEQEQRVVRAYRNVLGPLLKR